MKRKNLYEILIYWPDFRGIMLGVVADMKDKAFLKSLALLSQVGITIVACVLIGVFLGRFLDWLLGTTPWLLIVFSLFGVAAAFKSLFDIAKKMDTKDSKNSE